MRLRIPDKETTATEKTGGIAEKHASTTDINTYAILIASQTMKNHPLGRSLSACDDHEKETHDFRSQDIHMGKISAGYSLMPPDLTDSKYDYDSESDTEADTPVEHHPSGSNSAASTSSISSCKQHPPGRVFEPRTTTKDKPEADVEINSSNNARERLDLHRDRSKGDSLDKVQTKYHQPPGTH